MTLNRGDSGVSVYGREGGRPTAKRTGRRRQQQMLCWKSVHEFEGDVIKDQTEGKTSGRGADGGLPGEKEEKEEG